MCIHLCHTVVQCVEELSNPTNGNVMVTGDTYLSEAHYDCIEGYAVVGASVRVCQADGLWSASEPHCEGRVDYYHRVGRLYK